jgi:ribonuclease HI
LSDWIAFCDGACSGNPGPGGWAALIWSVDSNQIWELGGGEDSTTNNRMEMTAALKALQFFQTQANSSKDVLWLLSDSSYVVRGIEDWVPNWKARGWQKSDGEAVANVDLWKQLEAEAADVEKLKLVHIMGHSGVAENERVDEIAVAFSKKTSIKLFSGVKKDYPVAGFFNLRGATVAVWAKQIKDASQSGPKKKSSSTPKGPGTYYVSVVKGEIQTHADWADCEKRVKGTSGARFKKVKNKEGEESFLATLPSEVFKK